MHLHARHVFRSTFNQLCTELHSLVGTLEDMSAKGHAAHALSRQRAGREALWFAKHGPCVIRAARELQAMDDSFKVIADIRLNAFTSASGLASTTKHEGYKALVEHGTRALSLLGATGTLNQLVSLMERCTAIVEASKAPEPTVERSHTRGQQYAAVERVVAEILAELPEAQRHAARQAIAKSDNKLKALNAFLLAQG